MAVSADSRRCTPRWIAVAASIWSAVAAAGTPLSGEELAVCAQQVSRLRAESARILAENERLDAQREHIVAQQRALQADAESLRPDDVHAGVALHDRRRLLNDEAEAFNARIAHIRTEIAALNETWTAYDSHCSRRPYDRRDLERLPPAAQQAMRAGLGDVRVPYIPETMQVPEGTRAP